MPRGLRKKQLMQASKADDFDDFAGFEAAAGTADVNFDEFAAAPAGAAAEVSFEDFAAAQDAEDKPGANGPKAGFADDAGASDPSALGSGEDAESLASTADEERQAYEAQRKRRLQLLEQEQQQRQQQQSGSWGSSSSWGGWLSMTSPSMDLTSLQKSAEKMRKEASERAESAAAALKSAALQSPVTDLRTRLQSVGIAGVGMASIASLGVGSISWASATEGGAVEPTADSGAEAGERRGGSTDGAASAQVEGLALSESDAPTAADAPVEGSSGSDSASKADLVSRITQHMAMPAMSLSSMSMPSMPAAASFIDPMGWAGLSTALSAPPAAESAIEAPADANRGETSGAQGAAKGGGEAVSQSRKKEPLKPLTELEHWQSLLERKVYDEAASYAANSPKQELRTIETIRAFEALPLGEGEQPPILLYFGALLRRKGALTTQEGRELARGVCAQGQVALLKGWLADGKVQGSEEIADIIRLRDPSAALSVYRSLGLKAKVIMCYAELCNVEEVVALNNELEPPARPDWLALLASVLTDPMAVSTDRTLAVDKALKLHKTLRAMPPPEPEPDPDDELALMNYRMNLAFQPPPAPSEAAVISLLLDHGFVTQATALALQSLSSFEGDDAIDRALQTRLLSDNLRTDRGVGEALLEAGSLPDVDTGAIGELCEALGLHSHALRLYTDTVHVARVLAHDSVGDDAAAARVASMAPSEGIAVVTALLRGGTPRTVAKALSVARTHVDLLGHAELVAAFESAGSDVSLLVFLSSRLAACPTDPALTLTYLRAAKALGRIEEIERVTRDPTVTYDPQEVVALLCEPGKDGLVSWLSDPRPLINVCDRHDMVERMAGMLYERGKLGHLKLYVQRISPARAPQVAAALLDAGCEPPRIAEMIAPLGGRELENDPTLATRLIEACEQREQLALLHPWLTAREAEGLPEESDAHTVVHEALLRLEPPKPKGLWSLLG